MARNAALTTVDPTAAEDAKRYGHDQRREMAGADEPGDTPMTIAEVAREFGVTPRALRFYEARRLIAPHRRGAVRLYHRTDRERLMLILTGRRLGFTLGEIRDLLGRQDGEGLRLTREQCVAQINLLEQQKRGIDVAIAELRQICTSFYKKQLLEDTASRRGMSRKS
jgi:DNA-binding transcriptional MerR regulator